MDRRAVVTCFPRHEGAIRLERRRDKDSSHVGNFDSVTGPLDGDPRETAARLVRAETEGDVTTLASQGAAVEAGDRIVHPFLFDVERADATPDSETAGEWVAPTAIRYRETVPGLWAAYDRVRPTVDTVATDRDHGASTISVRALEVLRDEAAIAVEATDGWQRLTEIATELLTAKPSMSVVRNRVNHVMHAASAVGTARAVEHAAAAAITSAVTADRRAADCATERIDGQCVATLSRSGTVSTALERGDPEGVLIAESRPGREGIGVAEGLAADTDVTVTSDAGFAHAIAESEIDVLLIGADTLLPDGRVVNKVGTRGAAIASAFEGSQVCVVATADKLAPDQTVDIEPREASELYDGEAAIGIRNPTFDVTPPDCVDAVITEDGALDAAAVDAIASRHRRYADWERDQ